VLGSEGGPGNGAIAPAEAVVADGVDSGSNGGRQEGGGGDSGGAGGDRSVRGGHSGGSKGRGVEGGRRCWWQGRWGRWSTGKCTGLAGGQHGRLAVSAAASEAAPANLVRNLPNGSSRGEAPGVHKL